MKYLSLLLLSCTPIPAQVPDATPLATRGQGVCMGIRIAPEVLLTAKHCTKKGWALSVEGIPARFLSEEKNDLAYLSVPKGEFYPPAVYSGEKNLTVSTWVGAKTVRVLHVGPAWLELDLECLPGWSGSPVFSSRGPVAVVSRGAQGRSTCYVELIP